MTIVPDSRSGRAHVRRAVTAARALTVLRPVIADEVSTAVLALFAVLADESADALQVLETYGRAFELLASHSPSHDDAGDRARVAICDAWQEHLLDRLLYAENAFARRAAAAADVQAPLRLGQSLIAAVRQDLRILQLLYAVDADVVASEVADRRARLDGALDVGEVVGWRDLDGVDWRRDHAFDGNAPTAALHTGTFGGDGIDAADLKQRFASAEDWTDVLEPLVRFHALHGSGSFARFRAFRWVRASGGRLEGIAHPDPVRFADLFGYERERATLVENTERFVGGYPANNVLLYGDRGTGKSSSVKALLHEFGDRGLRIVEVQKDDLADLPVLLRDLRERPQRFIIFVDDLSFDEHETSYKSLKALLEGSLEARPANVLVYATSNRRHLVQEWFSDRASPSSNEVHAQDTMQEKLSLSDRFGITIIFASPDQERYLAIVEGLAAQRRLTIAPDQLRRRALQWATLQNGRSGRTARQFVDHLTAEITVGRAT